MPKVFERLYAEGQERISKQRVRDAQRKSNTTLPLSCTFFPVTNSSKNGKQRKRAFKQLSSEQFAGAVLSSVVTSVELIMGRMTVGNTGNAAQKLLQSTYDRELERTLTEIRREQAILDLRVERDQATSGKRFDELYKNAVEILKKKDEAHRAAKKVAPPSCTFSPRINKGSAGKSPVTSKMSGDVFKTLWEGSKDYHEKRNATSKIAGKMPPTHFPRCPEQDDCHSSRGRDPSRGF